MNFIPSPIYRGDYHYEEHGPKGPGYYLLDISRSSSEYQSNRGVSPPSYQDFYPTPYFQGEVNGYTFQEGPKGRGYYMNHQINQKHTTQSEHQPKLFHPSPYFQGQVRGYVFTTREYGTGYYLDRYAS